MRALLRDRGGQIWLGSYGGGLQRHNPLNQALRMLDRFALAHAGEAFADPNVRAVVELTDGSVLLGTQDRGILLLDSNLAPTDTRRDEQGDTVMEGVRVTGLAQTLDGALWIGGDAGLFRQFRDGAPLEPFPHAFGRTRRLLADPRGGLWIAAEGGLLYYDMHTGQLVQKTDVAGEHRWADINALGLDSAGRLWAGGDAGLGLFVDPEADLQVIEAAHVARGANSDVLGLLVDPDGSVWFDTPSGLFRLRLEEDGRQEMEAVSARFGVAGQPFGANLLRDDQGRIWSQSHVFDPQADRLLPLGEADGVSLGNPWFRSYAMTRDGRMLFGGAKGLLVVMPSQYHFENYAPPLVLTALAMDGQRVSLGTQGLELWPGQRSLTVEFAALDYSAPELTRYRYRLLGESDRWVEADAEHRSATFANLVPGHYRFELQGSNRHGIFSPNELAFALRVHPAWWQTWWARIGGAGLAAVLVLLLIQQRTRSLRTRRHELELSVAERTSELEAVSAALREKSRELEKASFTDPLTGLYNRRYFTSRIDADIERVLGGAGDGSSPSDRVIVFFLLDVDHFKQVNDNYGHAAGDAVLTQLGARLRACLRDDDDLVRWGGEEFLLVMRDVARESIAGLAERIVRAIGDTPFELPDRRSLQRTCPLGFAPLPLQSRWPHQVGWEEAIDLADMALFAVKRTGRNGWAGFVNGESAPLSPMWRRDVVAELDAGRLCMVGSKPREAMRQALSAHAMTWVG